MPILNHILGIPTALAQVASTANKVGEETTNEFAKLVANFFAAIPLWIAAIVVAILSYIVAILVKRSIENKMAEKGIEEEHKEIQIVAGRSAYFVVLVIGITISLSIVGIDLKPIVAAGAFGLGFALQDIIMNTISGMLILASRHYTIGDVISVDGIVGRIMEIQTRATIIKAFDGTKVIVPNANLFKNTVVSKTSNPFRKLSFVMGVGYGCDLKQVMDLTLAVVKNIPHVLASPKPSVVFYEWGDYSINFRVNVWIDSKGGKMLKVKNQVIMDLSKAYDESGLDIPYPIQTIYMDKAEEENLTNDQVQEKINAIKSRLNSQKASRTLPINSPLAATVNMPVAAPVNAQPMPVVQANQSPQVTTPAAPNVSAVNTAQPAPTMPSAIATTANSPGQSWLEKALATEVSQVNQSQANQPVSETPTSVANPTQTTPVESAPAPATPSAPVFPTTQAIAPQSGTQPSA